MNLQQQRDKEQKVLHGYGWVNQGAGIARMPIDEAKKLILERGLPVSEGEDVSPTLARAAARGESGGRIITAPAQERRRAAPEGGQPAGHQPGRRHMASSPPPSRRAAAATDDPCSRPTSSAAHSRWPLSRQSCLRRRQSPRSV